MSLISAQHKNIIEQHYRARVGMELNLPELSSRLGIPVYTIKYQAKAMGLTDITRPRFSGKTHPLWKGDKAGVAAKRHRARIAYTLGMCEVCKSAKAIDRHHVDGDTGNNRPSNILRTCRKCHMIIDGRLARFASLPRPKPQPPKRCKKCRRLYKPLRKRLCCRCYDRAYRSNR